MGVQRGAEVITRPSSKPFIRKVNWGSNGWQNYKIIPVLTTYSKILYIAREESLPLASFYWPTFWLHNAHELVRRYMSPNGCIDSTSSLIVPRYSTSYCTIVHTHCVIGGTAPCIWHVKRLLTECPHKGTLVVY